MSHKKNLNFAKFLLLRYSNISFLKGNKMAKFNLKIAKFLDNIMPFL
ncbi:hypothetical protein HMPREF1139_2043 [Campylobacter sp. FOBRC14]|nr:hypothetical protein HMPREF1139_2043 [Campylobacter sp. FOBRC14]